MLPTALPHLPQHSSATELELLEDLNDEQAIEVFLDGLARRSAHTVRSYRKECSRFILWLRASLPNPSSRMLPSVTVQEINRYIDFTQNPRSFSKAYLESQGWRQQPFRKPLSSGSLNLCITILHRMFEALRELRTHEDEPYCKFNPVKLAHQGIKSMQLEDIEQALSDDEWQLVLHTIEQLPREKPVELQHYHRSRWLFHLLYRAFLRREEAAQLTMGCFQATPDGWLICFTGKGNKKAKIVATNTLMDELRLYRESLNLPSTPSYEENDMPAVMGLRGNKQPITSQAIYLICKAIFQRAAALADEQGNTAAATRLRKASPHWMRHTGISHTMEAGVSPRYVQAQARHSSLNITARYDHKEKKAWRSAFNSACI